MKIMEPPKALWVYTEDGIACLKFEMCYLRNDNNFIFYYKESTGKDYKEYFSVSELRNIYLNKDNRAYLSKEQLQTNLSTATRNYEIKRLINLIEYTERGIKRHYDDLEFENKRLLKYKKELEILNNEQKTTKL